MIVIPIMSRLSLLTIGILSLVPLAVAGNIFYSDGVRQCFPHGFQVSERALTCEKADWFRYYTCGETGCDYHLQPWVFAVVSFIVISFLCSLVCSLLRCICCVNDRR
ncbi:hypothetical protein L596_027274 [Steinernema carpocapsae]|uniref:G-protein coupled receptors family 1 profile domain-containing protein n=2 Tax=Steinernema carpocapsae TaxID=34508 RepID=A0A4U5M401_STECR|nr:hypothetical protein L596_027274 [Steinernema carpocapsae]